MYSKKYRKIKKTINKYKYGEELIILINKLSTGLVYLIYPSVVFFLVFKKDPRVLKLILVPAISFILLSIFRNILNLPRPYERYDIDPIIKKETKGNSFPSRHVFSAFVIGGSLYKISPFLGLFILFLGIIISIARVLGGVHFFIDVAAGGLLGLILSYLGWAIKIL